MKEIALGVVFWVPWALWGTGLQAGVVPGRWEKVERLDAGTPVVLVLKTADRIEGEYHGLNPESLRVVSVQGHELELPRETVQKVLRGEKVRDSLRNGTLMGAAIGFGAGFASAYLYALSVTASGPVFYKEAVSHYVAVGLIGGGIGALTGALVDAAQKTAEVLYQSE